MSFKQVFCHLYKFTSLCSLYIFAECPGNFFNMYFGEFSDNELPIINYQFYNVDPKYHSWFTKSKLFIIVTNFSSSSNFLKIMPCWWVIHIRFFFCLNGFFVFTYYWSYVFVFFILLAYIEILIIFSPSVIEFF